MRVTVDSEVRLTGVPEALGAEIRKRLTMDNPKWAENEKMGRWQAETEEVLRFYSDTNGAMTVPRGFMRQLLRMCKKHGIHPEVIDNRRVMPSVSFDFQGTLRPFQQQAMQAMAARDFGTLSAPTGSGKTVIALAMIAQRRQPALVVVHTRELMDQWEDRIGTFLGTPAKEVGRIGGGKRKLGEEVTLALVQSLYKCAGDVSKRIGHLVVDECHRTPSRTFTEAVRSFDSRYMLGLSATPWRRDKLSRLIFWFLGDVVHEVDKTALVEQGDILPATVTWRPTSFRTTLDPVTDYVLALQALTEDRERNRLIARDVAQEAKGGKGVALVLSDRKAHCLALQRLLGRHGIQATVLTGDVANGTRQQIVAALAAGKIRVLVATGQLIGEGFDCRHLTSLHLATPIRFDGRLLQYLGRVLRPAPGKQRARIIDYIDVKEPVFRAQAAVRARAYEGQAGIDAHSPSAPPWGLTQQTKEEDDRNG